MALIDTSFDMRSDAGDQDPDSHSATLRRYHQVLWSKPLPGGALFDLVADHPGTYLYHHSQLGKFFLSSDSVMQTFIRHHASRHVISQMSDADNDEFYAIGYTIGAMMIFPSNRIDRKPTINVARGFHPRIADRFDLTVECIRRHYVGDTSPLAEVLGRYADFFALFANFAGYLDFFLLHDLVDDAGHVRFFGDFDDFESRRDRATSTHTASTVAARST